MHDNFSRINQSMAGMWMEISSTFLHHCCSHNFPQHVADLCLCNLTRQFRTPLQSLGRQQSDSSSLGLTASSVALENWKEVSKLMAMPDKTQTLVQYPAGILNPFDPLVGCLNALRENSFFS